MNPLTNLQIGYNRESQDSWELFSAHRRKVTELLRSGSVPGSSRLCVLGAGNANDLDLRALLQAHREVHLVDLDAEALTRGVAAQGLADNPAVHRYGGIDITGMLDAMAAWSPFTMVPAADLAACVEQPMQSLRSVLPGPFDVVASTTLLSQLIIAVVHGVGEQHPQFVELLQAVRAGHLRLLTHLVAPGGVGVLITDVVSSDSFPGLGSVPEEALPSVLGQLIRERNFFHGVNPAVLATLFRTDPVLCSQVEAVELLPPWRWNLGPRLYAVCALRLRRIQG
ncbi:MAG TPA: hypothetical protein VKU02_19940 [Gemmataceae bacterium]|nr:hypothetical protein [Gemmataceae bacterium]